MKKPNRLRAARALLLAAVAVTVGAVAAPAHAAGNGANAPAGHAQHAATATSGRATKPVPKPPTVVRPKTPARAQPGSVRPDSWSLNLTYSPDPALVTQYVRFTATANQPVDGTGYSIVIYDGSGPTTAMIASCNTGATCVGWATHSQQTSGIVYAEIVNGSDVQATSWAYPTWNPVSIESLTADQNTVGSGATVTLTATTSADFYPTALWLEFYDTTTGAYVGVCDGSAPCTVTVTQPTNGTHAYAAYLTVGSTEAYPPPNVEWQSYQTVYVTWTPDAYRVTLDVVQRGTYDSPTILHATSKLHNSSPYYVEVYNETTGTLTGSCYATVDCIVTDADPPQTFDEYVAFIADYSPTLPPSGIEASSPTQEVFVRPIP